MLIVLTLVLLVSGVFAFNLENSDVTPIDCKTFGVVYLKPSELDYASPIANKINGIVVIPELNQIIARTEIASCPIFNYSKYIGGIF